MEERFDYDGLLGVNSDLREQLADAQATVEALRRERDTLREATKVICGHCCEPMAIPSKAILQTHLSALQGLVRAISETMEPFRLSLAKLDEVDTLATRRIAEADAYYCAQRVLSTLPATPTERGEDHSGDDTDMVQKGGGDGE